MRRETQNILLVLLGGALLKLALTSEYLRYVKPVHQPWLIGAGAVMLLLGTIAIWRDLRADQPEEDGHAEHGDHAGHSHSTRTSWILLVPVLTVVLVAPPALGSDSVNRSASRGSQIEARGADNPGFPALPAGDPVPLSVAEFSMRAAWDTEESLRDRRVRLSGFVVHRDDEVLLARMMIGCCAADASSVAVRLSGAPGLDRLSEDEWIEATGTLVPGSSTSETNYIAELTADSVRAIEEPSDSYEY